MILDDGRLFSFGRDDYFQIGCKCHSEVNEITFFKDKIILQISCGESASFILTNDGLYAFGLTKSGSFCLEKGDKPSNEAVRLNFFNDKNVKSVHAGVNCVFILTCKNDENILYVFGENKNGKLGLGKAYQIVKKPQILDLKKKKVKEIQVFMKSTLILLENGRLLGFGNNTNGELGIQDQVIVYYPTEVPFFFDKIIDTIFDTSLSLFHGHQKKKLPVKQMKTLTDINFIHL